MLQNKDDKVFKITKKCKLGNAKDEEWEELYKYCFPQIYLFLKAVNLKFGFPIEIADLEDVAQDVFVKLIEKFPNKPFESIEGFNRYLFVVCKNYLIDFLRQTKFNKRLVYLEEYGNLDKSIKYVYQDKAYEHKESRILLAKGIEKLPSYCKKILNPLIREEMTLVEIARYYKIPEGSIYNQYRRCIEKLKKILESR